MSVGTVVGPGAWVGLGDIIGSATLIIDTLAVVAVVVDVAFRRRANAFGIIRRFVADLVVFAEVTGRLDTLALGAANGADLAIAIGLTTARSLACLVRAACAGDPHKAQRKERQAN